MFKRLSVIRYVTLHSCCYMNVKTKEKISSCYNTGLSLYRNINAGHVRGPYFAASNLDIQNKQVQVETVQLPT